MMLIHEATPVPSSKFSWDFQRNKPSGKSKYGANSLLGTPLMKKSREHLQQIAYESLSIDFTLSNLKKTPTFSWYFYGIFTWSHIFQVLK